MASDRSLDRSLVQALVDHGCDAIDKLWLQEDVDQGSTMRENFLSIASHELRTPLTALNLQLENLGRMARQSQDASFCARMSEKMARAFKQTGRLSQLIDNLLDVVALRTGTIKVATTLTQVKQFLKLTLDRWIHEAHKAGCVLSVECPDTITGMWDGYRMGQVLDHLLANAIKYGAGRPIELKVQHNDSEILLTLKDGGIGVPPHVAERIFGAFERAVSPREFGGLGLGLFLSRGIVEAHGGHMRVCTQDVHGAEFHITLPKSQAT